MRRLYLVIVLAIGTWLLQGCNGANRSDNTDNTGLTTDTATKLALVIDKDDALFVIKAANTGMAEVGAGKLAIQKGTDKRIKNFGAMMVKDHSKANIKLTALAKLKKITLPDSVGGSEKTSIQELRAKTGKAFDKAYISYATAAHTNAIDLFQDAAKHRFDPDIRKFADKALPMLKRHLDAIGGIYESTK